MWKCAFAEQSIEPATPTLRPVLLVWTAVTEKDVSCGGVEADQAGTASAAAAAATAARRGNELRMVAPLT
jgi:hypothetical protein